jgi:hypothetical protein
LNFLSSGEEIAVMRSVQSSIKNFSKESSSNTLSVSTLDLSGVSTGLDLDLTETEICAPTTVKPVILQKPYLRFGMIGDDREFASVRK